MHSAAPWRRPAEWSGARGAYTRTRSRVHLTKPDTLFARRLRLSKAVRPGYEPYPGAVQLPRAVRGAAPLVESVDRGGGEAWGGWWGVPWGAWLGGGRSLGWGRSVELGVGL